jgi:hypothetical protein
VAGHDRPDVRDRRAGGSQRLLARVRNDRTTTGRHTCLVGLAFSSPLMTYTYLIFTELPTGLLVI